MKVIRKKFMSFVLALTLILQCCSGVVIGYAENGTATTEATTEATATTTEDLEKYGWITLSDSTEGSDTDVVSSRDEEYQVDNVKYTRKVYKHKHTVTIKNNSNYVYINNSEISVTFTDENQETQKCSIYPGRDIGPGEEGSFDCEFETLDNVKYNAAENIICTFYYYTEGNGLGKVLDENNKEVSWMKVDTVRTYYENSSWTSNPAWKMKTTISNASEYKYPSKVSITVNQGETEKILDVDINGLNPGESRDIEWDVGSDGYSVSKIELNNKSYYAIPSTSTKIVDVYGKELTFLSLEGSKMYYDGAYKIELVLNSKHKWILDRFNYRFKYDYNNNTGIYYPAAGSADGVVDKIGENTYKYTYNVGGEASSQFDLSEIVISNVQYQEDTCVGIDLGGICSPSIVTDTTDATKYVAWSTVNFGHYYVNPGSDGTDNIKWRVLKDEGETLLLMADKALVSVPYGTSMGDIDWENSRLRAYLNNEFYNAAFNDTEKSYIVGSTVDNSRILEGSKAASGNATTDNVFVLSVSEMDNSDYGLFGSSTNAVPVHTRQIKATDYLIAENSKLKTRDEKCCTFCEYYNYYLRTPGYYQYDVAGVYSTGLVNASGWRTYTKTAGAVPVIRVNKSAVANSYVNTVVREVPTGYEIAKTNTVLGKKTKLLSLDTVKIGDKQTYKGITYKVTKSSDKVNTVSVQSVKKNAKKVTIPKTVTIDGTKYKVTSIKAKAFSNAKKTLKKITIKSTSITSISQKAFKGLKKGTTVKVASKKYNKYKKMINNKKIKVKSL